MTTKKTETKRTRAPRITAAEIRRREETQQARTRLAGLDEIELSSRLRTLAMKQAAIFDYELLIHVANHIEDAKQARDTLEQVLPDRIPGVDNEE